MKIKLDENIPATLTPCLEQFGHDVDSVLDGGLGGRSDEVVWGAAQAEGRFLITQDLDFSDARKFAPGTHAGILVVRLREAGLSALQNRIMGLCQTESIANWKGCLVVATDRKLRIRF